MTSLNFDKRQTSSEEDFDKISMTSGSQYGNINRAYKNTRLPNLISSVEFKNNIIVGSGNIENVLSSTNDVFFNFINVLEERGCSECE